MPHRILSESILLPELELKHFYRNKLHISLWVTKKKEMEVCPRCATPSTTGYDSRRVRVKDAPLRNRAVTLVLTKRR